jgi:DNA-binding MarR family transcriptional regulator
MSATDYDLDEQIGFLLRKAHQRHTAIFHDRMLEGLTTTQFAALAKLFTGGPLSQNHLGRETAMDAATIKGVVSRLTARGLVEVTRDATDQRRLVVTLTPTGRRLAARCIRVAERISEETLEPLSRKDRKLLVELLGRIAESD